MFGSRIASSTSTISASWEHNIALEKIGEAEAGVSYPRVMGGNRACPREDVGGYPGYAEFVEAIAIPRHNEHDSMLE